MFLYLPTSGKFTSEFHSIIKSLEMYLFFPFSHFLFNYLVSLPSVTVLNDLAVRCAEDDVP